MKIVVLGAGIGSRMGHPTLHKCLLPLKGDPFVVRMITNAIEGAQEPVSEIIFVVGHLHKQVIDTVTQALQYNLDMLDIKLTFVYNPLYKFHGSGFSVSLIWKRIPQDCHESLLVLEADCILPKSVYRDLVADGTKTRGLVGPNINPQKSVLACADFGEPDKISHYAYDRSHKNVYDVVPEYHSVLGESLQAWFISKKDSQVYVENCYQIYRQCNRGSPNTYSNLEPINRLVAKVGIDFALYEGVFINLNTPEDLELANSLDWT